MKRVTEGKKLKFKAIDEDFQMEGFVTGIDVNDLGHVTIRLYLEKPKDVEFQAITKYFLHRTRIITI